MDSPNWTAYNAALVEEKARFAELLADLCGTVEQPEQGMGRPRLPLSDMLFAAAYKVYVGFSARRFTSDLKDAHLRGLIGNAAHFNSVNRYMANPELTDALKGLVTASSLPLKASRRGQGLDARRNRGYTARALSSHKVKKVQMETETAKRGGVGTKPVGFWEAFWFWVKLGFINFGGPAGQIAIMHKELVEKKRWVSEKQYLRTLNFCMLLPGPEAQQVATYIGWRLHGTLGGIVAGSFFVIPSIFVLWLLSYLAVAHSDVPAITGLLYGIQPVVIAIVVEAVLRIGKRTINHRVLVGFAVVAFVALYFFSVPFPLVVLIAAVAGLLLSRTNFGGDAFGVGGHGSSEEEEDSAIDQTASNAMPSMLRNARLLGTFVLLWALPIGALWLWRGGEDVLVKEALFFTGAAFLTFGGAYSVLSYVADVAVNHYGWLTADQMVQGLGLAESTPGPLIMVTQYVGFIGAWNDPGPFAPLLYGTLGALVTTYATFLPCFLFIFFLAPYIELLSNDPRLRAILIGVTAAVVGVVANLAVYFATQVLFPDGVSLQGLDVFALVVAAVSFVVLQRYKVPIYLIVPAGAVLGMAWTLL